MRFRWKYLEAVGFTLAGFGALTFLPTCPYLGLFPPIVYGEPCDLSGLTARVGLIMNLVGACLFLAGEIGRRRKPATNAGATKGHLKMNELRGVTRFNVPFLGHSGLAEIA